MNLLQSNHILTRITIQTVNCDNVTMFQSDYFHFHDLHTLKLTPDVKFQMSQTSDTPD